MEAFGRISTALQGKVRRWSSSIARRGAAMTGISSVKISTKDDRVLDPAGAAADSYAFLLPLLAFSVLAVAAFGVCYDLLQAAEGPLINVDASNVELVQAARVRLCARPRRPQPPPRQSSTPRHCSPLLGAAAWSTDEAAALLGPPLRRFAMQAVAAATLGAGNSTVRALQAELRDAATLLLAQHQLLMTGAEFPGLHGNTVGADSASRKYLMFVEQCLRFDESQCVAEEHPFWTRVHHGLYALLRYYVQTALLLSRDPVSSLTADNPLFRFIEFAGPGDVYDGLIRNREIYYQDTLDAPKAGKGLLIAALPLICAGSWLFMQRYFGPWTKRTLHESKVVAEVRAPRPASLTPCSPPGGSFARWRSAVLTHAPHPTLSPAAAPGAAAQGTQRGADADGGDGRGGARRARPRVCFVCESCGVAGPCADARSAPALRDRRARRRPPWTRRPWRSGAG